jgi:hypothetical protein
MSPLERDRYFEKRREGKSYTYILYIWETFSRKYIYTDTCILQ